MVNKENVQILIDYMREHKKTYRQDRFFQEAAPDCKTPCCICGFGVFAFGIKPLETDEPVELSRIQEEVANNLGINTYQRSFLFISNPYHAAGDFTNLPTFDEAIEALETLRDTGAVEWPKRTGTQVENFGR